MNENDAALAAYEQGVAWVDRTDWGLISVAGSSRHTFLHNQTTADFASANVGELRSAVAVTAKARIVDWLRALVREEAIWLISSPQRRAVLLNWWPQFIFFMDDVQLSDLSADYALIDLVGPQSGSLLATLSDRDFALPSRGTHRDTTLAAVDGVVVAATSELLGEGYTLLVPRPHTEAVREALRQSGALPMPAATWEALRVTQGRPLADHELTEAYNPLEAGLWDAVSFRKGCYIGQEIIARLDTYQKLKQQLWGLAPSAPLQVGDAIHVDDKAVGVVTSSAETPHGPRALGYVRSSAATEGATVAVGGVAATLVALPLLRRGRTDL